MRFDIRHSRHVFGGVVLILASMPMASTAQAGFFEQLFGAPPPETPSYGYASPNPVQEPFVVQRHRVRPRRVFVEAKPTVQQPTDLMHDTTLRPGDAVMMKAGIRVYDGHDRDVHDASDFKPLDDVRHVKPPKRMALAALDATRNDPLAKAATPDTIASGRSAASSGTIVAGVKFTDQRGKTIRYVGP